MYTSIDTFLDKMARHAEYETAIKLVNDFLKLIEKHKPPEPTVAAGPDGMLGVSWERCGQHASLEFFPDGRIEFFAEDLNTHEMSSEDFEPGQPISQKVIIHLCNLIFHPLEEARALVTPIDDELLRDTYEFARTGHVASWGDLDPGWDSYQDIMLELLMLDEVLFFNSRMYSTDWPRRGEGHLEGPTLVGFVICNDTFAWACADVEPIEAQEVPELFRLWIENKRWGSTKWCALKRNMRPQRPVIEDMKKDGVWCNRMEQLPLNAYNQ